MSDENVIDFPCDFAIKIIGYANDEFEITVLTIIKKHFPDIAEAALKTRHSKDQRYLAITVNIVATSQQQLDNVYLELTSCEQVIMAL